MTGACFIFYKTVSRFFYLDSQAIPAKILCCGYAHLRINILMQ